ncbi:hypothetical protein FB451DRAFT_74483 [Mycena latifolia]|nr:hypothetical protein FB451DRAFT_74483 [Mycena latifolia]
MYRKSTPDAYSAGKRLEHPPSYRDAMYVPSRDLVGPGALKPQRYRPMTLRNWVVVVVVLTLIGLAIAIEVSLVISTNNGGFPTPERNVFARFSPRFFTAFFPTLLVAGLLLIWQSSDRSYKELQPYIVLARGNVTAAEGLLANYSGLSVYSIIVNAIKFRHFLILLSTVTTLLGSFLQPLAGSIIQIEQLPQTTNGIFVTSTKTIGLAPDIAQLNAFLAAAGFAEAAVFHSLPDPPFIHGGWSVAEFELPTGPVLNGTLSVNTTAIQTAANCEVPQASTLLNTPGTSNFTIQALNSAGCSGSVTFDPESTSSGTQYGAINVDCGSSDDVQFQPVMFWFFHRKDDDQTPQGASVFCSPTIKAFNVIVETDLNNGSTIGITPLDSVATSNNVTGNPQNGQAFNGLKFPSSNDTFVEARATSIRAGVSGAIFRFASQSSGGVQPSFDDPNGFLNITVQVFTQHLSLSANSIYFVKALSTVPAKMVSLAPRFVIDAFPAHALAAVLTLIGLSALLLHIAHSRQRRRFFLAASPGSIAHIISMTAHARFGEQLYPYDDDETLARKLAGLSFSLDPRTGAVVADRDVGPVNTPVGLVTPYTVTPYSVPNMRPRASSSALSASSMAETYSDEAQSQSTRLLPPMGDEKRWGRDRASSRGLGLGEGSSSAGSQLELQNMRQLPAYFDDRNQDPESQSTRLLPPSADEKRGLGARNRDNLTARSASSSPRAAEFSASSREVPG